MRNRAGVCKYTQYRKTIWTPLNFIDFDQSFQRSQRRHRFIQPGQTSRVFRIKVVDRVTFKQSARASGFAALAGACQYNNAAAAKHTGECRKDFFPSDHAFKCHENPLYQERFSWYEP
jgi:hypothetical protein